MGLALASSLGLDAEDPLLAERGRHVDRALARRCVDGERDAQRALFREHRKRVQLILRRLLGATHEIEDVSQDSFLEIFRSLARYRGDARLGTWIDRITTRVAYRHISRKQPVDVSTQIRPLRDQAPPPDVHLAARDAARRLCALIEALVPSQRIAFTLQVIDGLPASEVASVTGASLVATRVHVFRARRTIERRASVDPHLRDLVEARSS